MSIDNAAKAAQTRDSRAGSSGDNRGPVDDASPIRTAQELADAFKRSGEFDELRAEILKEFMTSRDGDYFLDRITDLIDDRIYELHPSSARPSAATVSKSEAMEDISKDLERHVVCQNAEEDMERYVLRGRIRGLERDLEDTLERSRRAVKRRKDSDDVEMEER